MQRCSPESASVGIQNSPLIYTSSSSCAVCSAFRSLFLRASVSSVNHVFILRFSFGYSVVIICDFSLANVSDRLCSEILVDVGAYGALLSFFCFSFSTFLSANFSVFLLLLSRMFSREISPLWRTIKSSRSKSGLSSTRY